MSARYTTSTMEIAVVPTTKSIPTLDGKLYDWESGPWETESPLPQKQSTVDTAPIISEYMNRWEKRPWPILLVILGGLLTGIIAFLFWTLQPQIVGSTSQFQNDPKVKVTSVPATPGATMDKTSLIIQQNVNCWLNGQPGKVCNPETRTYG